VLNFLLPRFFFSYIFFFSYPGWFLFWEDYQVWRAEIQLSKVIVLRRYPFQKWSPWVLNPHEWTTALTEEVKRTTFPLSPLHLFFPCKDTAFINSENSVPPWKQRTVSYQTPDLPVPWSLTSQLTLTFKFYVISCW
jgi:hypothetical protein